MLDCQSPNLDYMDPLACRALWCAVLAEAWRQATNRKFRDSDDIVAEAQRWFGSRDFERVCTWAGVDPDAIFSAFQIAMRTGRQTPLWETRAAA